MKVAVEPFEMVPLLVSGMAEKGEEELGFGRNGDGGMAIQRLLHHRGA
jgi:hypothetical protein